MMEFHHAFFFYLLEAIFRDGVFLTIILLEEFASACIFPRMHCLCSMYFIHFLLNFILTHIA